MSTLTITRGNTLPNSSQKADFHNLIDLATGSVSNIVNADIDAAAAIADTKLAQITTADKVSIAAVTKASNLTTVTAVSTDYVVISDTSDSGNTKKALVSDLTYTPTAANALTGSVVQTVGTQTGSVATGTTLIPSDDTVPQNTEGDQYMTQAITPTSATNKLKISVVINCSHSATVGIIVGLFQDSTAGALAAVQQDIGDANPHCISFTHYMTAGTTSATTFKVRAGGVTGSAGTLTFNGTASARLFGGVMASSIIIEEIKV